MLAMREPQSAQEVRALNKLAIQRRRESRKPTAVLDKGICLRPKTIIPIGYFGEPQQIKVKIIKAPPVPASYEDVEATIRRLQMKIDHLWSTVPRPKRKFPEIETIKAAVAKRYGVPILDMDSIRRTTALVRPRQIAMYLCRTMTLKSMPEIGRRFGGRDHTTVLHAVNKITALRQTDPALDETIIALTALLTPAE